MKINIGISEENRQKVAAELSKLLADEYVLFTKTKEAHWNIEGTPLAIDHGLAPGRSTVHFIAVYQCLRCQIGIIRL